MKKAELLGRGAGDRDSGGGRAGQGDRVDPRGFGQRRSDLGVPVKLVGLGEGPDDLAPFDPEAFVSALLD